MALDPSITLSYRSKFFFSGTVCPAKNLSPSHSGDFFTPLLYFLNCPNFNQTNGVHFMRGRHSFGHGFDLQYSRQLETLQTVGKLTRLSGNFLDSFLVWKIFQTEKSFQTRNNFLNVQKLYCVLCIYRYTRSLEALRAPTSRLRPFGSALGPLGLLDNVLFYIYLF